jgi:hypothetical protein
MFDLPYAGIVVQFLHYLLGLRKLGWDVWYVEDSLSWPYDPATRSDADDVPAAVGRVARLLDRHGFGDRWIYRCSAPEITCFGAGRERLDGLYREAEVALNVTGAQEIRDEHTRIPLLVYVQSDPFAMQVDADSGHEWSRAQLGAHHRLFTFGELVGTSASTTPTAGFSWHPTRQPVALELWPRHPPGSAFTTVTTWRNDTKHKVWQGERYFWTKDREFLRLIDLPERTGTPLELGIDEIPAEAEQLRSHGWRLVDDPALAVDVDRYQAYIAASRAEFTVARDQFVRPRTGWFSDRSACYLACGHPVVAQDTGFGEVLPTGEGLFSYRDAAEASESIMAVQGDPARHSDAARAIAVEHFAAERVLASLLDRAGA